MSTWARSGLAGGVSLCVLSGALALDAAPSKDPKEMKTASLNPAPNKSNSTLFGGPDAFYDSAKMNDPRINQLPETLTKTGDKKKCTNTYGVFDMVGNLHEWTADTAGSFKGGYYMDTHKNGDGCFYTTTAHG